jgi:hypothetical protein
MKYEILLAICWLLLRDYSRGILYR